VIRLGLIGLRWVSGLTVISIFLLSFASGLGGLRHTPQITYGIQVQNIETPSMLLKSVYSSLMAYDVWSGQSSPMLSHLTSLPVAWRWSPDGQTLAYVLLHTPNNTYIVMIFNPSDRRHYRLVDGLPFGVPPEWSPDGARIALVTPSQDICLYPVFTPESAPDCLNVMPASQPTWSPDGTSIAYLSRLPGGGVHRVDTTSRAVTEILPSVPYLNGVRWSPDGTHLIFSRQESPGTPRHLMLINADGTGLITLTSGFGSHDQARWSPDGTEIAYNYFPTSFRSPDIYIFNVADSRIRPIATHRLIDADPSWSPDGRLIAFVTDRYDGRPRLQIVTVPAEGEPEPIPGAGVPMHLYSYDWRP
jgi:Tol biopolymer transport system component